MMRRAVAALCVSSLLALSAGCAPEAEPPQEALDAFLRHWYLGEYAEAFSRVAPADRARIASAREALAEQGVASPPQAHELLTARRAPSPYALKEVRPAGQVPEAPAPGDEITLELERRDGHTSTARMVWQGGDEPGWFVRLPARPAGDDEKKD